MNLGKFFINSIMDNRNRLSLEATRNCRVISKKIVGKKRSTIEQDIYKDQKQ